MMTRLLLDDIEAKSIQSNLHICISGNRITKHNANDTRWPVSI